MDSKSRRLIRRRNSCAKQAVRHQEKFVAMNGLRPTVAHLRSKRSTMKGNTSRENTCNNSCLLSGALYPLLGLLIGRVSSVVVVSFYSILKTGLYVNIRPNIPFCIITAAVVFLFKNEMNHREQDKISSDDDEETIEEIPKLEKVSGEASTKNEKISCETLQNKPEISMEEQRYKKSRENGNKINLTGTYKLRESHNVVPLLKSQGVAWPKREIGASLKDVITCLDHDPESGDFGLYRHTKIMPVCAYEYALEREEKRMFATDLNLWYMVSGTYLPTGDGTKTIMKEENGKFTVIKIMTLKENPTGGESLRIAFQCTCSDGTKIDSYRIFDRVSFFPDKDS